MTNLFQDLRYALRMLRIITCKTKLITENLSEQRLGDGCRIDFTVKFE